MRVSRTRFASNNDLTYVFVLSVDDRIFLIENIIEMIVLGPMNYFRQVFLVFDLFVVVVSLTLELVLHQLKKNYAEVVSILVLFRLWRFVRIGHVRFFYLMKDHSYDIANCHKFPQIVLITFRNRLSCILLTIF